MATISTILSTAAVLVGVSGQAASADHPVAGVAPDRRPDGAPVISTLTRDPDWYATALRGVSRPHPESLDFLEDQGNWYTPFTRPGMSGRYDIRGLRGD